jgi:hypothetical protein
VGRRLLALFASVAIHHLRVVHRQPLVGVDSDTEEARVGLWKKNKMCVCLSVCFSFIMVSKFF